jgi:hypothetical protein
MGISTVFTSSQQRLDLIVIAQKRNKDVRWPVLEYESKRDIAATLEELVAKFADAQAGMNVRPAKSLRQLAQRQQTLDSFTLGQPLQASEYSRVNRQRLSQASSSVVPR